MLHFLVAYELLVNMVVLFVKSHPVVVLTVVFIVALLLELILLVVVGVEGCNQLVGLSDSDLPDNTLFDLTV